MEHTLKDRIQAHLVEYAVLTQQLMRDLYGLSEGHVKSDTVLLTTRAIVEVDVKLGKAVDECNSTEKS